MDKSSIGLDDNIVGVLCYVLGWVGGLVFLLLERESKFVRFHAIQSICVFGVLHIAGMILSWLPVVGVAFTAIISLLAFALWIVRMVKAFQGQMFKLPWSGDFAAKRMG